MSTRAELREERGSIRCAIYTRKSTQDGLEQEFNSLHAQREAAEAYIRAQKGEGWIALKDHYDDGGFSGGNTERPALQKLLDDVQEGRVDNIVVYKVDRLARNIADFARMVELLDRHNVSFISVTQNFNTGDSMGRLTLNILMTFAQFEREVIGERIRDKIALSKQKGKYMGGRVPTGYALKDHKLVIHSKEAVSIRKLFQEYAETGSLTEACRRVNRAGYRTKKVVFASGKVSGGEPFCSRSSWHIVRNRIYLGEVPHKGQWYLGQHQAIIDRELWAKVEALHQRDLAKRKKRSRQYDGGSFLNGMVYGSDGVPLSSKTTYKKGDGDSVRKYRYFISSVVDKKGYEAAPLPAVAAEELEGVVLASLKEVLQAPEYCAQVQNLLEVEGYDAEKLKADSGFKTLSDIGEIWSLLFPKEQRRLFHLLVDRVIVGKDFLTIRYKASGLISVLAEVETGKEEKNREEKVCQ